MGIKLPSTADIENLKKTLKREEQRMIERSQAEKIQVISSVPETSAEVETVPEPSVEEVIQTQDATDTYRLTTPSKSRRR